MKNLTFIFLALMILSYGCTNRPPNQQSQLMQACLDELYKTEDFRYLEKSPLILIENQYSQDLEGIHFGKNEVVLKKMSLSEQNAVLNNLTNKASNCFIIDYIKVENEKAEVVLELPMLTLQIPLKKNKEWIGKGVTVITGDNKLMPPPNK